MPNDTSPKLLWAIMTLYWSITGPAAKILPAMSAPMVANTMSSSKASRGGLSQDRRCPVHVATDLRRTMLRFFSDSARELGLPASGEVPAVWAKSPESEISITRSEEHTSELQSRGHL